jgi:hypothetical protein
MVTIGSMRVLEAAAPIGNGHTFFQILYNINVKTQNLFKFRIYFINLNKTKP